MDKTVLTIIIAIILGSLIFWGTFSSKTVVPEGIILFYGEGCPHCKNVDDYIEQNNIAEKVKFTNLEVWYNKNNQKIITEVAKRCKINSNEVGVPLLYDGTKCYSGDVDTIDFFKNAANIE